MVFVPEQQLGPSGTSCSQRNHWCLEPHPPGECQNGAFWVALELCSDCLNIGIVSRGSW